jgi:hydrogenase maturation protease
MKTVIIGLGNPILGDDSVGVIVSRKIRDRLRLRSDAGETAGEVDVKEVYAGGIRLMDAMTGYDRAWIIDAMVTGRHQPGTIIPLSAHDLCSTRNIVCTHDTNLDTALELGRMLGVHLPSKVRVWGIEASDVESFSERLTDAVFRSVPLAVEEIIKDLNHYGDGVVL